ncbi:MAG: histidinol-phosphate transaminase [Candidatus Omnitrophica bacterium]|nr:histidinol-phosphate transaminase [Candidatus Omnitrophota bacterium]
MVPIRKNIANIVPYLPGKPIEEVKRQLGLENIIKLASNENPLGASSKAKRAIKKVLSEINRYPEGSCFYLRQALSRKLKLRPNLFVFGNGSDELIDIIIKTFVNEDENIITADITFLEYQFLARVFGRRLIKVGLRNFTYDLKGILKTINKKTKVIFISNPNNPTGTYVNKRQLDEFLNRVPPRVIVVLDEAYDIFIDVDDFPQGLKYFQKGNIIVLKTFSKSYGLAGLRVGYAVARRQLVSYMERIRPPFNVNLLAQAGATSALEDEIFIQKTRRTIWQGKDYLYRQLDKLGLGFVPSVANFILIDTGRDGQQLHKQMLKFGVIIRDMKQYGLDNFIRVTIGTKKENERFIRVLKKVLTKRFPKKYVTTQKSL